MGLKLITPPAVEPLTPAEVRTRLGLGADVTDGVLEPQIKGARQEIDGASGWLGRCLITQTWDLLYDEFPCGPIKIPLPPLQEILGVFYIDPEGVEQTITVDSYAVDAREDEGWIVPAASFSWPTVMGTVNAVRIRFKAGYGDSGAEVPEPIRQAIAEKINLARMTSRSDPALRSSSVEGVGSRSWSTGSDYAEHLHSAADDRLALYRIWSV